MGKEAALKLIAQGHTVYGAARSVEKMKDLEEAGGKIIALDITNEKQITACVDEIISTEGHIDVLVNNAGFGLFGAVEDTTLEDARYQFEVNIFGLARLTQLVLPHMRKQKSGKIINISSMGGKMYTPLGAWYHATKHALEGWSDCLRIEVAPFGIHVVIIEPGVIDTRFGDVFLDPMLKRSGKSAYADLAQGVAAQTRESYAKGVGSPPSVIANVIAKAIAAKRPKTRYAAGQWARLLIFVRTFFGDRIFDTALMSRMR